MLDVCSMVLQLSTTGCLFGDVAKDDYDRRSEVNVCALSVRLPNVTCEDTVGFRNMNGKGEVTEVDAWQQSESK